MVLLKIKTAQFIWLFISLVFLCLSVNLISKSVWERNQKRFIQISWWTLVFICWRRISRLITHYPWGKKRNKRCCGWKYSIAPAPLNASVLEYKTIQVRCYFAFIRYEIEKVNRMEFSGKLTLRLHHNNRDRSWLVGRQSKILFSPILHIWTSVLINLRNLKFFTILFKYYTFRKFGRHFHTFHMDCSNQIFSFIPHLHSHIILLNPQNSYKYSFNQ